MIFTELYNNTAALHSGTGGGGGGWTPTTVLSSLSWWAEPKPANLTKVGGGTPVDGDAVSAITDLSGNSHTINQSVGGNPIYHTDGTHYWLTFNGTLMLYSATFNPADASNQHTTFATINAPTTTGSPQSIVDMDNVASSGRLSQLLRLNAGNVESIAFDSTTAAYTSVTGAASAGVKHVLSEITQVGHVQAFLDGVAGTNITITGTLSNHWGSLNLGGTNPTGASHQFFIGNWFGGFIYKGIMGSTDLAGAQTYMNGLAP